jgi:hypothetical protein
MTQPATLAAIQETSRSGHYAQAEAMLREFLSSLFPLAIGSVEVRRDSLSLNSVNGLVHLTAPEPETGAKTLFFKFHHEENEEGLKEYYNSKLLKENGYPVEMPVYASHEVGRQVLMYPFKAAERMADVCKRLDALQKPDAEMRRVLAAQEALDTLCAERYLATLHEAPPDKLSDEPILQLFHHRLVDDRDATDGKLGGRHKQFYAQKVFEFPGNNVIGYEDLAAHGWRINGVEYHDTLASAFARSLSVLAPAAHVPAGKSAYAAVVAHGDAHNGNVWYNATRPPSLSLFDPAFAGPHIPALLAEIKPTFHNIFAHPLWLYDSQEADAKLTISFAVKGDFIEVEHDWQLSPLRRECLRIKRDRLWKPLLAALRERKLLPADWQGYMRSALFCCPTLVMNLRAQAGSVSNSHTPKTSLLGLSVAMTLASAPTGGHDEVSDFFAALE